ncbi:hypothetical protein C2E21_7136 [Chlorella sorokiniana]|uniref:Uncharacterized protein n=1 Tax=Chlorella sorokiniana TaxID=3076 RepID=A0A2P6TJA7_CHLSO|nr:hypothetical protein C2E21_7136 [Chlorella sorokiniana]|eukprot:PRW39330.1 hypothetical protein C2E21_7136 [Chlorella sorokiniana]
MRYSSAVPAQAAAEQVATLAFPGSNALVSELHYLPHCNRLAALLDPLALLRSGVQQASALSVLDAATWAEAGPPMRDVLDGYELAAAVPASSQGGSCEFIAGSVKLSDDQASGWPCRRCYAAAPAATCFHKSQASAAALCFLDSRAQRGMVARYATHHRSLYPHLELVREHFLLTSHAGVPVAAWDRRRMNGPVHEVQHIPRELDPELAASLPLGDPSEHELPTSQALHLSATADLLVGRADNGMCWLFDLSERLGWADGSHPGTWLRMQQGGPQPGQAAATVVAGGGQAGTAAGGAAGERGEDWEMGEGADAEDEQSHLDEGDFDRAPLPLGCIGAPFEVWCSNGEEAPPLHWLPRPAAWLSHNHQLLALGGLELEEKQQLFPAYAQGSPYPSNALTTCMPSAPCVPTFQLVLERDSSAPQALDVPCCFTGTRYDRLVAFLHNEHWTVAAPSPRASAAARLAGCSEREVHAAELMFIRTLGMLRSKAGTAVPEKVVGKLLGIGVKALHTRCEQLFGCKWAAFLGQPASSSAALSSPTASSQPCFEGEEEQLCPAAPATTADLPAVLPAPPATAAPSAATAATLEPLLEPCILLTCPDCEEDELFQVINLLRGPSLQRGANPAAGPATAAAAAATATTSCGCCNTGMCGCDALESVFSAGQQQQQQQQEQQEQQQQQQQQQQEQYMQLAAAAAQADACLPPTPAAAPLPLALPLHLQLAPAASAATVQSLALAPAGSAATVQVLPPVERLSSSLVRLLAEMDATMAEPPFFDAAPATPAVPAAPAAPAGYDVLMALDAPDFPFVPMPHPADPLNLPVGTVADYPFLFL